AIAARAPSRPRATSSSRVEKPPASCAFVIAPPETADNTAVAQEVSRVDRRRRAANFLWPNSPPDGRIKPNSGRLLMRKTWTYGALLIACHAGADAAYVIKLKNGNEYVTSRYWNEGGQVLFDTYNGVFGVDRAFIRAIERSERALSPAIESTAKESRPDAEPKR